MDNNSGGLEEPVPGPSHLCNGGDQPEQPEEQLDLVKLKMDASGPRFEIPDNSEVSVLSHPEFVLDQLKCIMCLTTPPPNKALVCKGGHLLCESCFCTLPQTTLQCPKEFPVQDKICDEDITKQYSSLYEAIYNHSYHACKFSVHGCKKTLLGINLQMHVEHCHFGQPGVCPMSDCFQAISLGKFIDHVITHNNVREFYSNEAKIQGKYCGSLKKKVQVGNSYRWAVAVIHAFETTFIFMAEEHFGGVSMWLTQGPPDGTKEEELAYAYRLNITSELDLFFTSSGQGMCWEARVQSFGNDLAQTLLDGNCFTVNKDTFFKRYIFLENDARFWLTDLLIWSTTPLVDTSEYVCDDNLPEDSKENIAQTPPPFVAEAPVKQSEEPETSYLNMSNSEILSSLFIDLSKSEVDGGDDESDKNKLPSQPCLDAPSLLTLELEDLTQLPMQPILTPSTNLTLELAQDPPAILEEYSPVNVEEFLSMDFQPRNFMENVDKSPSPDEMLLIYDPILDSESNDDTNDTEKEPDAPEIEG